MNNQLNVVSDGVKDMWDLLELLRRNTVGYNLGYVETGTSYRWFYNEL